MKNPAGFIRSLALGFSLVTLLAAAPAAYGTGATTQREINPTGGVLADGSDGLHLYWGSNSQVQIKLGGSGQVYSPTQTPTSGVIYNGVYLRVDRGTNATTRIYTNDNDAASGGFATFTQVSQTATAGVGTAASPWTVTTVLKPSVTADNGITVTIIDSYIRPQGWFTRHVDVIGLPTSGATVKLYQSIDTYLQGGDNGPGFTRTSPGNTSGIPDMVGVIKNTQFEALWYEPSSGTPSWDRYFSGTYSYPPGLICRSMTTASNPCVTNTGDLSDVIDTNAATDNAMAAQWNVPANAATFAAEYRVTFATGAVDLTKAFGPATIAPNGVSTLTFSLTNKTVNAAASINFLDTLPTGVVVAPTPNIRTNCPAGGTPTTLPSGMSVVAASGADTIKVTGASTNGAASAGGQVVCTVSVDVTAGTVGVYHNTNASISGTNNLSNLVADEVLTVVVPQLTVTKSVQGSLAAGQTGAAGDGYYQITVQNSGGAPTAGAITLVDTLPVGVSATAVSSGNGSVSCGTLPATGTLTCTFTPSAPIAAGGSANVRINVAISAAATGSLTNTVAAAGGGDPDPLPTCPNAGSAQCAQTTNPVTLLADLSISKTDGSLTYTPGAPVVYTIVVANAGPSNATDASVTDTLPAALLGPTWSCVGNGGATCPPSGAGDLAAVAVSIPVGGQVTFTVSGVVSPAATGSLSNTATAAGATDPDTANNSATDTDTAALRADIEVVKNGTASIGYGGALSYTVVVTNHGPGNANGATFNDAVPAGITGVGASCAGMSGGAICVTPAVAGNTVSATIGTLPANGSVTYTITGTAPTSGTSIINTASANPPAGTIDPESSNNTGSATTTLLQPQLTVTKTATPNPFTVGQPASYTIIVANTGAGPTSGAITVADNLPSGLTFISITSGANWNCTSSTSTVLNCIYSGTLAAGASSQIVLNVNVGANATNANNTATASGGGDSGCPAASRCTGGATVPVNASADIAVSKSVDNATPNVGDDVTFTITATNNGPNNATGVTIADALPNGLAFVSATPSQGSYASGTGLWTVGALANGASATLQLKATVLQAGALSNTATKTAGDQFDPVGGNNAGSASLNANPTADLQISKTVDHTTPNLGTDVTYAVTVHNAGPNGATGVVIDDLLPPGLNLVTATPSQGNYNAGTGVWTVGALANAADATLVVVATVTLPGDLTNTASVAATDQHDPNPANDSAGVTINGQSSDLQVVKGVDNANPVRGDTITFTITTTNNGPSAATGVAVTDALPAGLGFVSATPSQGTYDNTTGVWTIGNLAASGAGATVTLTIKATVDTDAGFTNTASLTALDQTDPNLANNGSSVPVAPVANADIAIVKTGPANATAGRQVAYTLAVTNHGPSPAMNVSLADPTPAGLTFVSADAPCASGFPCNLGTLANGATATVAATFAVPSGASGTITNIATGTSPTDTTPANDSSTVTTPIVRSADIDVHKTGPATVTANGAISYSVVVTDHGPSDANGTVFSDPVPAAITGVSASCGTPTNGAVCGTVDTTGNAITSTITTLPSGASVTFAISGTAPAEATSLRNTATIAAPAGVTDPDVTNDSSWVDTTVTTLADLGVVKSGPASAIAGATIGYTIAVTNHGPSTALAASLADQTPAGLNLVSASAPCAGGFPCALGDLAAGATVNISVSYAIPAGFSGTSIVNTASASSTTADPDDSNDSSTVSTSVARLADLEAVKTGTASSSYGGALTYSVVVTNHGPSDANGATFTDAVPTGITAISASCGSPTAGAVCGAVAVAGNTISSTIATLPNGASVTFTINGSAPTSGSSITNTASASAPAGATDPLPGNNTDSATTTLLPPQLTLTKTASPTPFTVGQPASYTLTLTNSGTGSTTGAITATDNLPSGLTFISITSGANWNCTGSTATVLNCIYSGTLAANASSQLVLNVNVAANAANANNTATASGGGDSTCPAAAHCIGSVVVPVAASADIAVTKTVDHATPNVGENVVFTITATNNGPNNADGVAITDALPNGLAFVSATPSQGTYVNGTGLWTVGALANGASANLQITAKVLTPGGLTNTATRTAGNQFDPDTGNNAGSAMLNANPSADLQITKIVDNATPNLGTNAVYTITLTNAGPNDATGVVVDDLLPAGLNFVSAIATLGAYDAGTGLWTVGAVDAGTTQTLTITATVTLPGDITNTATIDADQNDPNPANNSSGVTLNGQSSDIQVIKGVDNANPLRGNTVTFTITATNNGPSAATGVAITDALPTGLLFVSATPSQGTYAVGTGIWSVGNLAGTGVGATATLTVVATVDTDDGFTNTASLTALDQTDPNLANNSSSVVVSPVANANLAITKTDGNATAVPGDTVTYTIVATNAGPSDVTGATITDTLPVTIIDATWTAVYAGGAAGFASGAGDIDVLVDIPVGGTATITVTGTISASATGTLENTATIAPSAGVTDPSPSNNSATDTDTLIPTANLDITKTDGSATYTPGAAISYTIVASNTGPSLATGAIVTDTIPAAITGATWTVVYAGSATGPASGTGNISATVDVPVGGTATFTVTGTVSASATGALVNTATIAPPSGTTDPTPGNNSATDSDNAAPSANLGITKTDGNAAAIPGGPISYTIVATNTGPSTATGAVVNDTIPATIAGAAWTAVYAGGATGPASGTGDINATVNIPVGATATFTVTGTVSATATGTLANTATVTPPSGTIDPAPGDNTATDTDTLAPSANLGITKTDGSPTYTPGATISYTIVASNAGPSIATGAVVTDTLPATISGATWTAIYAGGATGPANGTGSINATVDIPVGATATFTLTGTVNAGATGNLVNTASIAAPTGTTDPDPANDSATDTDAAAPSADIVVAKTGPASTGLGATLAYTVLVSNNGPSDANGATFSDPLPAGITGVTANCGTPTGGAACGAVNVAGGTVTSTITTLPSGSSVTFTIDGTAPLTGTTLSNTATANPPTGTTDPGPSNNADSVSTTLLPAQLTVTKTATPNPFVVGQPAQYTIAVQNTGSGTTNAPITVVDALPTGIRFGNAIGTNWTCTGTTTLSCTFSGTLAPNATATLTLNVNVAASATTANNAATATGGGDPTCSVMTPPTRCTGTVTDPVAASADIAVAKIVDNATPNVGQNVVFTITAANNGPSNATGVAITDALPSGLAFVSAIPSQGTFTSATGLWTVGALTDGSGATLQITAKVLIPGTLTNTATKTAGDQLDPDTSNNAASASLNAQPSADLQVLKTVDNPVPNLGTNVTFTITVSNAGPNDATGVVISDALPLGLNFVSATPSQGAYDDATGLWTVGAIAQGTSQTLSLVATATLPGDVMNNASVSASGQFDPNPANNGSGAIVNGQSADIQVVKTADNVNPIRGDTVTFTITATNNGPSNATGVAITDALPTGLVFVSSTASQGAYAGVTGVWTLGNLAATGVGATATLTIVATVDTDSGFTNTAAVSAAGQPDPNAANNSSSVVVNPIANSDLSITKTDGSTTAVPGTVVTYTIVASNAGPSTATAATVTDTLPATITAATWTAVYSTGASGPASGAGDIDTIVTIPSGGTVTFLLTGTIGATATGTLANTASIAAPAGTTDPTPGNNSAADMDTLIPTANIGVVKTGPANVTAGDAISYSVVVSNAGPSAANGATLSDAVPASITGVTATCGSPTPGAACGAVNVTGNTVTSTLTTLPSGGSVTFTIGGTAPADSTSLSNTAIATVPAGVTDPDPVDNSSTANTTVSASADLSIVKTGPSTVQSGAPISYTLLIHNAGPSAADGATYSDAVPVGITGVIASCGGATGDAVCANPGVSGNTVSGTVPGLPSGGSVTITISGTAPFGTQMLNNTATVIAPAGVADPDAANNSSSMSTTIGGAADIALTKTVDNAAPNVGDTVVFTITASNVGPNDASGVAVTDSLPAGLGFVSATSSQGTYTSGSGLWAIGGLANGDAVTLTITATVDQPGSLTNTVAVSAADQPDPDTSNNNAGASLGAGATADIGIAKSVDNSAPNVGDTVTYTLTVTNHGPNDATGVEATDHLPTGTTFVSALPSQGAYDDVGGVWTIGGLANGASVTLMITAGVDVAGSITNTATLTHEDQFDPVGANNQAGTTINGQQADLGVTKTIDTATPNVGETVTFTVTVHNNGPSGATSVALTDQLPAGLAYVSSTASQGAYSNTTGIWTVGSLSAAGPTSSATLTMLATVTQAGALVNTASVSASDQPDPNTTNNSGSAPLNGNPLANLAVDKSGPASVTPGNDVVYTVVVTNNGPSDATNVIVTDPTPAGLTFVGNAGACTTAYPCSIAAITNGASATITTTYTVPANYTGANPIINTAGATSGTPDPDTTDNQSSVQTGVGAGNADLSIVKTGPATIASGASITYALAILNNGPSPANDAAYTDNVPAGITAISASCGGATGGASCSTQPVVIGNSVSGTVGSLPSGGGVVVTITGTAGTGPLMLTNTATVDAPAGVNDPDPANNTSTISTDVGATSANLSVHKLGPASVAPGSNVTYTLTVTNAGPDTAINAVLDDPAPAGLTFVSASIPCAAGFPCALGDIASGGSTIVTVTFAVPAGASGSITNTATIGSDTPDPTPVDNTSAVTTTIVPGATSADLAVMKAGPATIAAGADITYALQVTNNGPDAAANVVLADDTPPALIFVSATAPCAAGFPCNLGTLANGATTTISVTLSVREGATAPIVNTASATSDTPDPDGGNNSSTVTSTIIPVAGTSADLVVMKTGPANAAAGSTISYTIAVVNQGPDAVPDAVLTDPTPAGLFYVASSAPCAGGFPCALGAIANGERVSVTVSYEVDAAFSGTITNIASANSTTMPDPTPDNNASAVTTTVAGTPSIDHTLAVPVDAHWMLMLLAALLMRVAAPRVARRR